MRPPQTTNAAHSEPAGTSLAVAVRTSQIQLAASGLDKNLPFLSTRDAGYVPPALSDPQLRRRPRA
ncbi:hypothetical protein OG756_03110 [Streptomyces sp. NBC_01310]|uniref:hypothetical protein n=1 Tax=Streptomyces sp. NBC_01310 TaxID=2903820 RepID=UPI0035B5A1A0|nr:hypothetical protein OG756_03110 [Streptomyces sp. NBC_01310]